MNTAVRTSLTRPVRVDLLGLTEQQLDTLVKNEAETTVSAPEFFPEEGPSGGVWKYRIYSCANSRLARRVPTPERQRAPRSGPVRGCKCMWSFSARRSAPDGEITVSYYRDQVHNEQCLELQALGQQHLSEDERAHLQHTVDAMPYQLTTTILRVRHDRAAARLRREGPRVSAARRRRPRRGDGDRCTSSRSSTSSCWTTRT